MWRPLIGSNGLVGCRIQMFISTPQFNNTPSFLLSIGNFGEIQLYVFRAEEN
jgi:hypothetical protein